MSHSLSKRIILSPTQLQRLLGRDRELTSRTDAARMDALSSAAKAAQKIGSSQAYAQYSATQQRHLSQAAQERDAALELVVTDPAQPSGAAFVPDLINFEEEEGSVPLQSPKRVRKKRNQTKAKVELQTVTGPTRQRRQSSQIAETTVDDPSTPKARPAKHRRIIVHSVPSTVFSPIRTRSKGGKTTTPWLRYGKSSVP